tara:strand:- start:1037 stop:1936 length:900 start_codon:yes stop_codon:yes gene_type:complete
MFLLSPIHDFNLWSQVIELRGTQMYFTDILTQAHFLRFFLVYPIFYFSDILNIDAEFLFKITCFINLSLITLNCIFTLKFYEKNNLLFITLFFCSLFICISAFMNGRIIFSFLGFSYFVLSLHKWEFYKINDTSLLLKIFISLFLCSVSTGTFLANVIVLFSWMFFYFGRKKGMINIYLLSLLISLSPIIYLYLFKNINYYGGGFTGFLNMLDHGLGFIFYLVDLDVLLLLVLNILIAGFLTVFFYFRAKKFQLLSLIILNTTFAGFFGFSTLTLALIPLSIFLLAFLVNYLNKMFPTI